MRASTNALRDTRDERRKSSKKIKEKMAGKRGKSRRAFYARVECGVYPPARRYFSTVFSWIRWWFQELQAALEGGGRGGISFGSHGIIFFAFIPARLEGGLPASLSPRFRESGSNLRHLSWFSSSLTFGNSGGKASSGTLHAMHRPRFPENLMDSTI